MSEILAENDPSQHFNGLIAGFLEERGLQDAVEITFASDDGGQYWLRRIDGYVQSILCRLPVETHFESDVQVHWSISPNDVGDLELVESMYLHGFSPDDPASGFVTSEPVEIDFLMGDDLVDGLLREADVVETDIDDQPDQPVRATAGVYARLNRFAVSGVLATEQLDLNQLTTGIAAVIA